MDALFLEALDKPPSDDYPEGVEREVARLSRDGGRESETIQLLRKNMTP